MEISSRLVGVGEQPEVGLEVRRVALRPGEAPRLAVARRRRPAGGLKHPAELGLADLLTRHGPRRAAGEEHGFDLVVGGA